jgi:hypothetical protein
LPTQSGGVPFVLRAALLLVMFAVAFRLMQDFGFTPASRGRPLAEMRAVAAASINHGWRVPAIKWLMVESLFTGGVGIYGFYALQPYLLELHGDPHGPTPSPACRRRSWPAPRSSAAWRRPASAGCSVTGPRR